MQFQRAIIWDLFSRLSDGDRSCVLQMLQNPNGVQLTSLASAHDDFYKALYGFGFAAPGDVDPSLGAVDIVGWQLTARGREEVKRALLGGMVDDEADAIRHKSEATLLMMTARFSAAYAAIYLAAMIISFIAAQSGWDLAHNQVVITAVFLGSNLGGLYFALGRTGFFRPFGNKIEAAAHIRFAKHNRVRACSSFAAAIFLMYFVIITIKNATGLAQASGQPSSAAGVLLTLISVGVCWLIYPQMADYVAKQERIA